MPTKLLFLFCIIYSWSSFAQEKKKEKIKISGSAGLYGDFYKMKADTPNAIAARRPPFVGRAVLNTTISYRKFSLPITMSMSSFHSSVVVQAPIPNVRGFNFENIKTQVMNPQNRIGIAPKYKWAQLMLGSQVPNYSELSVGDLSVFGAGITLTPKKFRFSVFAGKSQLAVNEDLSQNIQGVFARKMYMAKIGLGHEDSSHFYIITSLLQDDTASLSSRPSQTAPQAGTLSSLDYRLNFSKTVYLKGEVSASAFTRNSFNSEIPNFSPSLPKLLFIPRNSSRFDYASIATLGKTGKIFNLKLIGRYLGDGFVPLGFPFLQTDRAEATIEPGFNLFKNKVQLSGSIGRRINNLSGIRGSTSTQTIGSANVNIQFSESFNLSGSYSNFGFRNAITNDTFRVQMVTNSWSITPTYSKTTEKNSHNISLTYSNNVFRDFNVVTGALNDNDANNALISYTLTKLNNPFSLNTILSYFDNNSSLGKLTTNSANITAGYAFFKKKINTTLGLTVADNKYNNQAAGFQVMPTLGLKYRLNKKMQMGLNGSLNLYEFGTARPGISYQENMLRTFITYQF